MDPEKIHLKPLQMVSVTPTLSDLVDHSQTDVDRAETKITDQKQQADQESHHCDPADFRCQSRKVASVQQYSHELRAGDCKQKKGELLIFQLVRAITSSMYLRREG